MIKKEEFAKDSIKNIERFHADGYLEVRIGKKEFGDSVILKVYPGSRFRVHNIKICGSSIRHDILFKDLGIEKGDFYSKSKIENGIQRILNRHLDNGHPFCSIKPILNVQGKDGINVELKINGGPLVKLSSIVYKGGKTRSWAIRRWMRFKPGIFSQTKIDQWVKRLRTINYIGPINEQIIHSGSDYYLMLEAEELTSEVVEGGGSYSPDAHQFLLIFSVMLDNLLGTMRKLTIHWESSRRVEVSYLEPWLIYPISIGLDFKDIWYDTLRVDRGEIDFISDWFRVYTGLERGDKSDEFIGLGLGTHTRSCSLATSIEFVRMLPDRSHIKLGGCIKEKYYPFEVGLNLRHTTIKNPEIFDLFQLGGINSLRGYWPDEFYFQTGGWINCELRLIDLTYPFLDLADLDQKWYYSTGIGFEFMGRNIGLKLAIGLPIWDPFQTKVHARVLGRI